MEKSLNGRMFLVLLAIALAVLTIWPNFKPVSPDSYLPNKKLKYGLDIQGGLHLVMGVDVETVLKEDLVRLKGLIKNQASENHVTVESAELDASGTHLNVTVADVPGFKAFIEKYYNFLNVVDTQGNTVSLRKSEVYTTSLKKKTLEQAIEIIRNRVDEFGVAEPSITAQGTDRILIQLPGLENATRAKELVNRTARLDFYLVSSKMTSQQLAELIAKAEADGKYSLKDLKYRDYVERINKDLTGKIPEKTRVTFGRNERVEDMTAGKIPYLLETDVHLSGDRLNDATVGYDEFGASDVNLSFDPEGAKAFGDITGANVGRLLAIVLDDVVYSAPNLKERIGGGRARITLGGGRDQQKQLEEASILSMALRAGALPARLEQLEERTVGPSLGNDSIQAGKKAGIVCGIVLFLFMFGIYKAFGLIANLAMALNVLFIFAVLTWLDATLSLPGILGISLTMAMSVDANVLIYERIKEELRKGTSLIPAIKEGYSRSFSAIFDANLTTALSAFVLMYFGTGPVRGFAVTLVIGMVTNMFAAIFVTRVILDLLTQRFHIKRLPI